LDLLKEARIYKDIKAYFLLNQMQTNTILSKEAKEAIDGFDADVRPLETVINARIAYKKSFGEGKSVLEWTDPKAKEEITNLYNEILSLR